ncbi:MAG: hypothetical protein WC942_12290 [Clostridia bacterium]|jgi:hypothetical protein
MENNNILEQIKELEKNKKEIEEKISKLRILYIKCRNKKIEEDKTKNKNINIDFLDDCEW